MKATMLLKTVVQKRKMTKNRSLSLLVTCLIFIIVNTSYSQEIDPELVDLITDTKAKMKGLGYKFIEQVQGETSSEKVLEFKQQKLIYGYSYVVVSFFKKCNNCHLTIEFWNTKTEATEILGIETIFNDSSYNISKSIINKTHNTAFYIDYSDKRGRLHTFVNSNTSHYLRSMLFYR